MSDATGPLAGMVMLIAGVIHPHLQRVRRFSDLRHAVQLQAAVLRVLLAVLATQPLGSAVAYEIVPMICILNSGKASAVITTLLEERPISSDFLHCSARAASELRRIEVMKANHKADAAGVNLGLFSFLECRSMECNRPSCEKTAKVQAPKFKSLQRPGYLIGMASSREKQTPIGPCTILTSSYAGLCL